jgi:putative ABC transport system permease protein
MNAIGGVWAVLAVTVKRLYAERWLALAMLIGLVTAVALTVSIPLYADAIYYRVLTERLSAKTQQEAVRPPLAFHFRRVNRIGRRTQWEDILAADAYLTEAVGPALELPQELVVRFVQGKPYPLYPQGEARYTTRSRSLTRVPFATVSALAHLVTVVDGALPAAASPSPESAVEVLISEYMVGKLGLQVGETYLAMDGSWSREGLPPIPVRIAGVWRATDAQDERWFYPPSALDMMLLVPEETFAGRISAQLDDEIHLVIWRLVMDGSGLHAGDAEPLIARIAQVRQRASELDADLQVSPVDSLLAYRQGVAVLTTMLYAFSVPVFGLILAFIGLVMDLSVERRRTEIAVLRSRGATVRQVVASFALEGSILCACALAAGFPAAEAISLAMSRTRSFLEFTQEADLRTGLTMAALRVGLVVAGLTLLAQMLPAVGAARATVLSRKQEQARTRRLPWWQRFGLDVFLLVPAVYGAYVLHQQGSIVVPVMGDQPLPDRLSNPLFLIVPSLFVLAATLLVLRVLPLAMAGIAWVASRCRGTGLLIAARHLARSPGSYAVPLALLILTLSLAAYTGSLAQTLDEHLHDQAQYAIGADMHLEGDENPLQALVAGNDRSFTPQEVLQVGPRWAFRPVAEHLKLPGVQAATRVGQYPAVARVGGVSQSGAFMGVDRVDFPRVAFWRVDFAPCSLGSLMNALATPTEGVLVPREFMEQHDLDVGDRIEVTVDTYGQSNRLDLVIVGGFDLFPSWYPLQDIGRGELRFRPLFVGNLDHLFERAGGNFPYDVWLRTSPDADYAQIAQEAQALHLRAFDWQAPRISIQEEQRRPGRQGLFGLLSVGFIASALLTVLGFLLYSFFSYRRRAIELGVLRAMGLSVKQMTALLAWELVFLIGLGAAVGTGLGAWISRRFIPYLQVGVGPEALIPPYAVEIAWPAIGRIYLLLCVLFIVALVGLVWLLVRIKIFQAIKLGEAT